MVINFAKRTRSNIYVHLGHSEQTWFLWKNGQKLAHSLIMNLYWWQINKNKVKVNWILKKEHKMFKTRWEIREIPNCSLKQLQQSHENFPRSDDLSHLRSLSPAPGSSESRRGAWCEVCCAVSGSKHTARLSVRQSPLGWAVIREEEAVKINKCHVVKISVLLCILDTSENVKRKATGNN